MPGFKYEALEPATGKLHRGVLDADNARLARQQLRDTGLMVQRLDEISGEAASGETSSRSRAGIGLAQLAMLTRQWSTLLDAGLTIEQALQVLVEQSEGTREREVMAAVRSEIMAGVSLSRALSDYPRIFPDLYRTLVAAGEESGKLPEVMRRLADYIESNQLLRSKIMLAMIYPAIISGVSVLVVGGLLTYVVPQVVNVFQNTHQQLPLLTRGLLALSAAVKVGALPSLIIGVGVFFAFRHALRRDPFRLWVDRRLLTLPLAGRLIGSVNTARLASTLAIMVGSGVPLLLALQHVAGVVINRAQRQAISESARQVREGVSLAKALGASKVFPPVLIHLIASGEASGRLEYMLERAAAQQSQELENRVATLTGLLEPLMILVMGGVVLLIVMAILMPVFEMNQLVK